MSRPRSTSSTGRSRSGSTNRRRRSKNGSPRRTSPKNGGGSGWSRHGTALPTWTDLEKPTNQRRRESPDDTFLEKVSTVRFAAVVLLVAAAFTLYVGHVHATKDLLGEVQELRSENQRLHLKRNRLQGEFARKTSPSVIYERARELGLQESVTYGPPVSVE
jgi:cell division protein FtsL